MKFVDELDVALTLNEAPDSAKPGKRKKKHSKKAKQTKPLDIRDMFRRQGESSSKRLRAENEKPETIIID